MFYLIIVGRGNFVHEYYQLPLALPMVVFVAKIYTRFAQWPCWKAPIPFLLAASLAITLSASAQRMLKHHDRVQPENSVRYALAERIAAVSDPDDRVIVIDHHDPTVLYLAGRKGWRGDEATLASENLAGLIERGAVYAAGIWKRDARNAAPTDSVRDLMDTYSTTANNDDFYIVRLH